MLCNGGLSASPVIEQQEVKSLKSSHEKNERLIVSVYKTGPTHTDLFGFVCLVQRDDVGHERTELDVLVVTGDVDGVFAGLRGPVTHVTRPVVLVLKLDFSLRRSLNGKACRRSKKEDGR